MVLKIALFGSGSGTSIEFVLNSMKTGLLDKDKIEISKIVTVSSSGIIDICNTLGYSNYLVVDDPKKINSLDERHGFERKYRHFWFDKSKKPDVILLLGWKYILSNELLEYYNSQNISVLNMHPSLPNSFVGNNCAEKSFMAYQRGEIKVAGSMIHECTPCLDRGKVIDSESFEIQPCSLDQFTQQLKFREKTLINRVLLNLCYEYSSTNLEPFYRGKVRDITNLDYNLLLMTATDRISSFDRHLTHVPMKGHLLNSMSAWWFNNTKHIIDNHYLYHRDRHMVVKKCLPIKLEVVVRAYMTGSSSTSIWKQYNNGVREMYGLPFRDGYKKNEPLDEIVITPTTKGDVDLPLTKEEIVSKGYLTVEQREYVYSKALELFIFGASIARSRGLILVDTKYEFGFCDGKIILMDEIHTCDSSRYWKAEHFLEKLALGQEPDKLDKDCIRDYVKKTYSDEEIKTLKAFVIPDEIVAKVSRVYNEYHTLLTGNTLKKDNDTNYTNDTNDINDINSNSNSNSQLRINTFVDDYFSKYHRFLVVIIAGSTSDRSHVEKIIDKLKEQYIYSVPYYKSAHKNTRDVLDILDKYNRCHPRVNTDSPLNVVFVTVAGRSNALSGVVASNTRYPVIACPPFSDKMDMFTNINSTLQCPSKVPVLTCLEPGNVAICVRNIFEI